VPSSVTAGGDLAFLVTLTNRGTVPAVLNPCPTYTEDLIVYGRALKPPAPHQFLLNCAAIGPALAPGASVTPPDALRGPCRSASHAAWVRAGRSCRVGMGNGPGRPHRCELGISASLALGPRPLAGGRAHPGRSSKLARDRRDGGDDLPRDQQRRDRACPPVRALRATIVRTGRPIARIG
jgi:hypothetical protein